jgi:hypothetical protein
VDLTAILEVWRTERGSIFACMEPRIIDPVAWKLVTIPTKVSWLLYAAFGTEGKLHLIQHT